MCDNCLIIQSVSLVIGIAFVSGRCAGACRTVLVSAALRWSLPHRPCIGGSALVLVALPLYRRLCDGHYRLALVSGRCAGACRLALVSGR
jgi:hypothetical protein